MENTHYKDILEIDVLPRLAFLQSSCLAFSVLDFHSHLSEVQLGENEFTGLNLFLQDIEKLVKQATA